ncbi:MAG: DUF1003 domain-containing protein [Bdellovibrio bacteriovorus]
MDRQGKPVPRGAERFWATPPGRLRFPIPIGVGELDRRGAHQASSPFGGRPPQSARGHTTMSVYSVAIWIVAGLFAGWIARLAMRSSREYGIIGDLTTGCLGAVIGGWLLRELHVLTPENLIGHVLIALSGAGALLACLRLLRRLGAATGLVAPEGTLGDGASIEAQLRRASELERRLVSRFLGRRHAPRDVNADFEAQLTFGERVADKVASFGGSWVFIGMFFAALIVWMAVNEDMGKPFDPYPFILLNLILSCLAAVQAPIIMMSQNRQAAKDRLDARNDFEVNLRAEIEIMALHEKLDGLRSKELLDMMHLIEEQMRRLESLEKSVTKGRGVPPRET